MTEDDINRIMAGIEVEWSDDAFCADSSDIWWKIVAQSFAQCRVRGPDDDEATTAAGLRYRHNVTVPAMIELEGAIVFAGRGQDVGSIHAMRDDWRN